MNNIVIDEREEVLDLVDESDNVIGVKKRSDVYKEGLHNFRLVYCVLKNKDGLLWIPRRTATKSICPLHLAVSMGGHVSSGETYELTLKRELEEELNIDVSNTDCTFLGQLTPLKHGMYAFSNVYEIIVDEAPNYNPSDFCEYLWLTPQEVIEKQKQGEKLQSDLEVILRNFYLQPN